MRKYPNRQIHLDFHTSPLIPEVGCEFDQDEFGKTLGDAGVQLINLFGKCHHGWFYYPTKVGRMHPSMKSPLLPAQIKACRERNIDFTIYTCVGWNEDCATSHPEWQEISPEGILGNKRPFERGFYRWQKLCLNNLEYRALIKAELKEEYELYKPLGFWIDIILQHECICASCRAVAKQKGLRIEDEKDRRRIARMAQIDYMRDIREYIAGLDPELHVYFNGYPYAMDLGDDPELANANKRPFVTFMDIESIPSTEWGYSHYPIAAHYVNKYDKDLTMMNGKFHLAWGDFGSLRNKAALEYECFRALATGAGICVGDQLHPSGKLDPTVYKRIGAVFKEVEAVEPWCLNTRKMSEIGVYGTIRSSDSNSNAIDRSAEGAYRVLTELKLQYDFLDLNDDISRYRLLVIPDSVHLTKAAARKVDQFVAAGGRVLATGISGLDAEGKAFLPDCYPVKFLGQAESCPRYMDIAEGTFADVPAMKYVAYLQGAKVSAKEGAVVLAQSVDSYFNRSEEHFCSHRQTPPMLASAGEPAIVLGGGVAYVSNPLFADFAEHGVKAYKDILAGLIQRLLPEPLVTSDLPAYAEIVLRRNLGLRDERDTIVVHVLAYIIQRKCQALDTIEDAVPLHGRRISVRCGRKVASVMAVPSGEDVPFSQERDYVSLTPSIIDKRAMYEIRME